MRVLIISSVLAAIAGMLYAGRLHSGRFQLGEGDELSVIAAAVLGGTSLFGGAGTVVGSIVGSLMIGVINNGLLLMGLEYSQQLDRARRHHHRRRRDQPVEETGERKVRPCHRGASRPLSLPRGRGRPMSDDGFFDRASARDRRGGDGAHHPDRPRYPARARPARSISSIAISPASRFIYAKPDGSGFETLTGKHARRLAPAHRRSCARPTSRGSPRSTRSRSDRFGGEFRGARAKAGRTRR